MYSEKNEGKTHEGGCVKEIFVKLRSSHYRCSVRKGVLRNFAKLIGKHLPMSDFYFLIKLQALVLQLYQKRGSGIGVLILQNYQEHRFAEHLWTNASEHCSLTSRNLFITDSD